MRTESIAERTRREDGFFAGIAFLRRDAHELAAPGRGRRIAHDPGRVRESRAHLDRAVLALVVFHEPLVELSVLHLENAPAPAPARGLLDEAGRGERERLARDAVEGD